MKATVKIEQEIDVKYLRVCANVRYWEDGEINGEPDEAGKMPCRNGETWDPIIEVETGKIINWTNGVTARIHYKVCDEGAYALWDANRSKIHELEGYVPDCMSPAERGFGDYIIMNIDENGMIEDWKFDEDDIDNLTEQD